MTPPPTAPFRVFGSPFALQTQQMATYLRMTKLPHTLYTQHAFVSMLAARWYGAADGFSALSPDRRNLVTTLDLAEYCEKRYTNGPVMVIDRHTHPWLRVGCHSLNVYAQWWLMLMGGSQRWAEEGSSAATPMAKFWMLTNGLPGLPDKVAWALRERMQGVLSNYGVTKQTAPYMRAHFERLCLRLDDHLRQHDFLLGTPKPTLCDCLFAAAFNGQLLREQKSRDFVVDAELHSLLRWAAVFAPEESGAVKLEAVTRSAPEKDEVVAKLAAEPPVPGSRRRRGGSKAAVVAAAADCLRTTATAASSDPVADAEAAARAERRLRPLVDQLPDTLEPVLELVAEVAPLMESQCEAARRWYATTASAGRKHEDIVLADVFDEAEPRDRRTVRAHRVPLILEQPWVFGIDATTVECNVAVNHVAMAQRLARDCADIDLDSPARARPADDAATQLPREAITHLRDQLLRFDTGLFIQPERIFGRNTTYAVWSPTDKAAGDAAEPSTTLASAPSEAEGSDRKTSSH